MKRRGFTIVELLMVIGIIGVLMGIVTTAASGAVRNSRKQRAQALGKLVQAGMEAYYAKEGEWSFGNPAGLSNKNRDPIELTGSEVREAVRKLAEQTKKGTPVMDVSGLFVSRSDGELNASDADKGKQTTKLGYGLDFMSAIRGTRKTSKKMKLGEMYFGYPDSLTGKFLRFRILYSETADSVSVKPQRSDW